MSHVEYGDSRDWTAISAWADAIADDLAASARTGLLHTPSPGSSVAKGV